MGRWVAWLARWFLVLLSMNWWWFLSTSFFLSLSQALYELLKCNHNVKEAIERYCCNGKASPGEGARPRREAGVGAARGQAERVRRGPALQPGGRSLSVCGRLIPPLPSA